MTNCIECTNIYPHDICSPFELGSVSGGIQSIDIRFENIADGSIREVEVETDINGTISIPDLQKNVVPNVFYYVTRADGGVFTLPDGVTVTGCVRVNFKRVRPFTTT